MYAGPSIRHYSGTPYYVVTNDPSTIWGRRHHAPFQIPQTVGFHHICTSANEILCHIADVWPVAELVGVDDHWRS